MLLVGCWKYGLGNWDQISNDKSLGLGSKVYLDEGRGKNKKEDKKIPNAVHLVRRSDYLLNVLKESVDNANAIQDQINAAGPPQGAAIQTTKYGKHANSSPQTTSSFKKRSNELRSSKEKEKKKRPTPEFTDSESDDCASMDENEMKEKMRPVRKQLKSLKNGVDELEGAEKLKLLKDCLRLIGSRIEELIGESNDIERTRKHALVG